MAERLQKWLASLGLGSRREIERWISAGRIQINGKVAELGVKVDGTERILVDGQPVRTPKRNVATRALIYYKPPGEMCTRDDPEGRRTVFESLPHIVGARWITVGRLDFQTTGLLLVTNDGELANKLMHPSGGLQREYSVRVLGDLTDKQLEQLTRGVQLDDGVARFDSILISDDESANKSYFVTVSEGRNRIIRRMFEAMDCRVSRLMRTRYGPIDLPRGLQPGHYQEMSADQLRSLRNSVGR